MTLFTWLTLGHFVGDFVFQNDWMARNKQRALHAPWLHSLYYLYALYARYAVGL